MLTAHQRGRSIAARLVLVLGVLASPPALAHLDPPGPPAYQEIIWLMSVTVSDDMDTFGAGELSLSWVVTQMAPHTPVTGAMPAAGSVALSAPPPAAFPGAFPLVLYNHLNCSPLELPYAIALNLSDDDVFGADVSSLTLVTPTNGAFVVGNGEFTASVLVGIFPAPQFNALCAGGAIPPAQQPAAPLPPATPSIGPGILQPPAQGPLSELPAGLKLPAKPLLQRGDAALLIGIALGILVALIAVVAARRARRRVDR